MRPIGLLRLVCSLVLMISAWPTRAGVVCVVRGRVVAECGMSSLPQERTQAPRSSTCGRMACCRQQGAAPAVVQRTRTLRAGAHCEYAYRSGPAFVSDGGARKAVPDAGATLAPAPTALVSCSTAAFVPVVPIEGPDSGPPRARPRAPDRGRAPPA